MTSRIEKLTLAFALGLPCVASLGLMVWRPGRVAASSYAVAVSLLLGTAIVVIHTWKSSQDTGSVGQLLYDIDHDDQPEAAQRRRRSWTGGGTTSRARLVGMMALSALTTALLVTVWLS